MRRSLALTAGALALAVPTLSSCGFNYATDEIYTASAGTDVRTSAVDVLNAVIVSDQENVGAFVATFSNNNAKQPDRVVTIAGGADTPLTAVGMHPIRLVKGGYVNLADDHQGILVQGTFKAGDFVSVSVDFGNAESVTFLVPVVRAEGPYADLAPAPVTFTQTAAQ
jgi:hypothetical protein